MISLHQIERLVEQEAYGRLVRRVLANGRCADSAVLTSLREPGVLRPAALGLALQRVCELSYEPSPTAIRLARLLLRMQTEDGRVGPLALCAAATAIAMRGLLELRELLEGLADHAILREVTDAAIRRGIESLAARQRAGAIGSDTTDAAIVLWQLGGSGQFREGVCMSKLMREVAMGLAEGEGAAELCRFAYAAAA